jgi:conjugal transfer pilus assembly protein TraI
MSLLSRLAPWSTAHIEAWRGSARLAGEADHARSPAEDPGMEAASVKRLLESHESLLARIKLSYGVDRATFEAQLLAPIRNLAGFVNTLPATPDNYFSQPGGLFRLALEVGFYALQGTDGHIVSGRSTISTRRQLEPRWRQATFLAGLCSELHRTLGQIEVTSPDGTPWPAYVLPLTAWLRAQRLQRFHLRWLTGEKEFRSLGLFALRHIVPDATLQHLATANSVVVPQLLACVAGIPLLTDRSIMMELVERATALVIDRDLLATAKRQGRPLVGAHLERYLLEALQRLVSSHTAWAPNQERSRVWVGEDGLYIVWPNAFAEVRKLFEEDELPGMPKTPDAILKILLDAQVFQPRSPTEPLWLIAPPPGATPMSAAKLAAPQLLLAAHPHPVAPLPCALAAPTVTPTSAPSSGASLPSSASTQANAAPQAAMNVAAEPPTPSAAQGSFAFAAASEMGPALRLAAPLRLSAPVRDALVAAIDSLNDEAPPMVAAMMPSGVFVALEHFKRCGLELSVVLRSLAEAGMMPPPDRVRFDATRHELGGQSVPGLVIAAEFVRRGPSARPA